MAMFLVVASSNPAAAFEAVKRLAGENFRAVKDDTWFMEFEGTSQQLAEQLGFISGVAGAGVVVPVSNYSGRASAEIWEWLRLRLSRSA